MIGHRLISRRALLVFVVGLLGAALSFLLVVALEPIGGDVDQVIHGSRALLDGRDPYAEVGPGRTVEWIYDLYYPLPAMLLGIPLTALPLVLARSVFFGVGSALMAWVFTRTPDDPRILLIVSGAFIYSASVVQWEPLLVGAALVPSLGFLLAAKPTVGAAVWIAYPSRRALIGIAAIATLSVVVMPEWVGRWLETTSAAPTARPLAWHPFGWIALLAALRWRDSDARLVAALCLVPITPLPYSAVLLFPAVRSVREAAVLIVGSWTAIAFHRLGMPYESDVARLDYMRGVFAATCTIPMAAMILLRPRAAHARAAAPDPARSEVPA